MPRTYWAASLLSALLFMGLMSSCTLERVAKRESRSSPKHGACVSCHRTSDPASAGVTDGFAGGLDPSSACLDCHHYATDHHPVEVPLNNTQQQGDPLPLFDGRIRCLTCHQAHKDARQNDLGEGPMLLRGGPYPDVRQFCYRCHPREQYQQIDPHRMTGPAGEIREIDGRPVCLFCHRERPELDADPDEVTFQADVAFLCRRCHAAMSGSFLDDHFHAKPKRSTRREMRRTEKARTIILPLARDGRITCSTCHNPHQEGVLMRTAARAGADRQKRLRLPKEEICGACHRH